MTAAPIFIVSGVPGAGKTTVTRALCRRFEKSVHIPGDDVRRFVERGHVSALDPTWTAEHSRQFDLSWRTAAMIAAAYSDGGFTVVVDDVLREADVSRCFLHQFGTRELRKVLLAPSVEVALARNRDRDGKDFDTALLIPVIQRLDATLRADVAGWTIVDTSSLSVDETVDAILRE